MPQISKSHQDGLMLFGRSAVNAVLEFHWNKEKERHKAILSELILSNTRLGGTLNGFIYDGRIYATVPHVQLRGQFIKNLHDSLEDAFLNYLDQVRSFTKASTFIRNAFSVALSKCESIQEIRDVLPEVMASRIPAFANRPRAHPEGFLLSSSPQHKEQFDKAVEMLFEYEANRLIY